MESCRFEDASGVSNFVVQTLFNRHVLHLEYPSRPLSQGA